MAVYFWLLGAVLAAGGRIETSGSGEEEAAMFLAPESEMSADSKCEVVLKGWFNLHKQHPMLQAQHKLECASHCGQRCEVLSPPFQSEWFKISEGGKSDVRCTPGSGHSMKCTLIVTNPDALNAAITLERAEFQRRTVNDHKASIVAWISKSKSDRDEDQCYCSTSAAREISVKLVEKTGSYDYSFGGSNKCKNGGSWDISCIFKLFEKTGSYDNSFGGSNNCNNGGKQMPKSEHIRGCSCFDCLRGLTIDHNENKDLLVTTTAVRDYALGNAGCGGSCERPS